MKLCLPLMFARCCALALPAMAGTEVGTIRDLWVRDSDGLIWVDLTEVPGTTPFGPGHPACAAGTRYWIVPNETTDTGKRLYDSLLAAQTAGRSVVVTIHGKNTCNRWGDGEDIDTIVVWGPGGPQ